MAPPAIWKRTLDEARRQALVAIEFYNRPGERRSFGDFIVHMHLAWQGLLLADRLRRKVEVYYREPGGRKFIRNADGSKKTWDLSQCLKHEFKAHDPIRVNIDFFIGLRNYVEHRFQDSILNATAAQTHACIINFESELVRRFGSEQTLGGELKFPIFIQSLSPLRYEEQQSLRRMLPLSTSTYITDFHANLPAAIQNDERFVYRLLLIPMKGPKTEADLALNFVRQDDLSPEELESLLGQEGSVIIAEKFREAIHGNEMLPGDAAAAVQNRIPYTFGINDFTRMRKAWKIGPPKSGSQKQMAKSEGYCVFSPAFGRFVYRPALIDRMVKAISDEDGYRKHLGKAPEAKPESAE